MSDGWKEGMIGTTNRQAKISSYLEVLEITHDEANIEIERYAPTCFSSECAVRSHSKRSVGRSTATFTWSEIALEVTMNICDAQFKWYWILHCCEPKEPLIKSNMSDLLRMRRCNQFLRKNLRNTMQEYVARWERRPIIFSRLQHKWTKIAHMVARWLQVYVELASALYCELYKDGCWRW